MARSFNIRVTGAVINSATRENSARCMIAQGVRELGGTYPTITKESVAFNLNGIRYIYPLPAKAAAALMDFDKGKEVKPFVLRLNGTLAATREVIHRSGQKQYNQSSRLLKGAKRKTRRWRASDGVHRGTRRADGFRMIEVTKG